MIAEKSFLKKKPDYASTLNVSFFSFTEGRRGKNTCGDYYIATLLGHSLARILTWIK